MGRTGVRSALRVMPKGLFLHQCRAVPKDRGSIGAARASRSGTNHDQVVGLRMKSVAVLGCFHDRQ